MHRVTFAATICLASALATPAVGDHIPGHDNSDPVFPVPLPTEEFFNGGVVFVTAIGPAAGTEITNTTFDITWVSDGITPASDLMIEVGVLLETGFAEFEIHGSDLGFGSGAGTFHGTFSTDALNGIVAPGFIPPHSIVHLTIGSITGGIDGYAYFESSFINFDVIPVPAPSALAFLALGAIARRRRR
jgi:hypothetical protein